jgi:hypothetical protein
MIVLRVTISIGIEGVEDYLRQFWETWLLLGMLQYRWVLLV